MEAAFEKHLEDEASKPKVEEIKYSRKEIEQRYDDRKKQFMECALQTYNNEEDLAGVCALFLLIYNSLLFRAHSHVII
jgi:hypothetical protein